MGAIQVRNVPEPLHEAVRVRATDEGVTVSEYVLSLLRREIALPSQQQWLERVASREPVAVTDVAAVLDGVRSERDEELRAARRG